VGHSFGANVASVAAVRDPGRVAALGLWEPPVPWAEWSPPEITAGVAAMAAATDTDLLVDNVFGRMFGREHWAAMAGPAKASRRADGPALRADMASELEPPYRFEDISVPVVVGYGAETWPYHPPSARHLAAVLGCEVIEVPGADHFAHANHPAEFTRFVRAAVALAGLSGAG